MIPRRYRRRLGALAPFRARGDRRMAPGGKALRRCARRLRHCRPADHTFQSPRKQRLQPSSRISRQQRSVHFVRAATRNNGVTPFQRRAAMLPRQTRDLNRLRDLQSPRYAAAIDALSSVHLAPGERSVIPRQSAINGMYWVGIPDHDQRCIQAFACVMARRELQRIRRRRTPRCCAWAASRPVRPATAASQLSGNADDNVANARAGVSIH